MPHKGTSSVWCMLYCSASLEELSDTVVCRFLESSQVGYANGGC